MYRAHPSSLGACRERSEVKEGRERVKKYNTVMCISLSQASGSWLPYSLETLDLNKGILSGRKKQGCMFLHSVPPRSLSNEWDGYLRQKSFCSAKIFFAGVWIPWNPWDLIDNPAYTVLYEFPASICHLLFMNILGWIYFWVTHPYLKFQNPESSKLESSFKLP